MFRFPKDDPGSRYYIDSHYKDGNKFTAAYFPSSDSINKLKLCNFKGSVYDIRHKIEFIRKYVKEGALLDFGANWGYEVWQFSAAGFSAMGYEVSLKRAEFGRGNLGINIITESSELDLYHSRFDLIFVNHVLEHIEDIRTALIRLNRLLKEGGYLFLFLPNCTDITELPWEKTYAFGQRHCLAFDKQFFFNNLPPFGFRIIEVDECPWDNYELLVVAVKQSKI